MRNLYVQVLTIGYYGDQRVQRQMLVPAVSMKDATNIKIALENTTDIHIDTEHKCERMARVCVAVHLHRKRIMVPVDDIHETIHDLKSVLQEIEDDLTKPRAKKAA